MSNSIQSLRRRLSSLATVNPEQAAVLNNLGVELYQKYTSTKSLVDLDEAIQTVRQAVDATPEDSFDRASRLGNLSAFILARYKATNETADLEETVKIGRLAVAASPKDHPAHWKWLVNLGTQLGSLYGRSGRAEDLDEAIDISRRAVESRSGQDKDGTWNNLGNRLATRYMCTENMADLDESIDVARQAVSMTPEGDPELPGRLSRLAMRLSLRHDRAAQKLDLDDAIQFTRRSIDLLPQSHPNRPIWLRNLAEYLHKRYTLDEAPSDLDGAVEASRESLVTTTSSDDPEFLRRLRYHEAHLLKRYRRTSQLEDAEEGIEVAFKILSVAQEGSRSYANYLDRLSSWLRARYLTLGDLSDLEAALAFSQEAVNAAYADDPELFKWLHNLGTLLDGKYSITGDLEHLEEAIRVTRRAVTVTPEDFVDRVSGLNVLAVMLSDRHVKTGSFADLEEVAEISKQLRRIDESQQLYTNRARTDTLRGGFLDLYTWSNRPSDSDHVDQIRQKMVDAPRDELEQFFWYGRLANALRDRYEEKGLVSDLEEAVRLGRDIVARVPDSFAHRAVLLLDSSLSLNWRYERFGTVADLDEAITVGREAVSAVAQDHPLRSMWLSALSCYLQSQFLRLGRTEDLEEAIQLGRDAVSSIDEDGPHQEWQLRNLAMGLSYRFTRMGALNDLNESVDIGKQMFRQAPQGFAGRAEQLNNLGVNLLHQHLRTQEPVPLDEAIQAIKDAVSLAPESDADRNAYLLNLCSALSSRFSLTRNLPDIEEAITVARQVISATPTDHADYPKQLNNLAVWLRDRSNAKLSNTDLDEAIEFARRSVTGSASDDVERARRANNLGQMLCTRYIRTRAPGDLDESNYWYQSALDQGNARVLDRVLAGSALVRNNQDRQQAYEAGKVAVGLVASLTPQSLDNSDKQHALGQLIGLASDAAAAALRVGESPPAALHLLELGRGVLGASLEEIRGDVDELREKHAEIAETFTQLQNELQAPRNEMMIQDVIDRGRRPSKWAHLNPRFDAGREFGRLIDEIRKLSGFEGFLLPPNDFEIRSAAKNGPIVIINVSELRCDALVVQADQIEVVPLPNLSLTGIERRAIESNPAAPSTLEWLWDAVARPVLDFLGFVQTPISEDTWPHIWWIPTGPLSQFALHAAGHHRSATSESVLDRVVSSYTSSLKTLVYARRRSAPLPSTGRALLVAMENTHGFDRLPNATKEIQMVEKLLESSSLEAITPERRKEQIALRLRDCQIFHFAGHGHTNRQDPSRSGLILEDGRDDPLRVMDLMDMNLRQYSPFLAYLSACGTGQIKNEKLVDESVHLINAFHLAGFRHVIGTLWEVRDETCVGVAKFTYEWIKDTGMTDATVCMGLHRASRALRDQWIKAARGSGGTERNQLGATQEESDFGGDKADKGSDDGEETSGDRAFRNIVDCDDDAELGLAHWAPYVHYGI